MLLEVISHKFILNIQLNCSKMSEASLFITYIKNFLICQNFNHVIFLFTEFIFSFALVKAKVCSAKFRKRSRKLIPFFFIPLFFLTKLFSLKLYKEEMGRKLFTFPRSSRFAFQLTAKVPNRFNSQNSACSRRMQVRYFCSINMGKYFHMGSR